MTEKDYRVEAEATLKKVPKRLAFIKKDSSALVRTTEEDVVMAFPHLVVRGIICFQVLTIVLAVLSLLVDAPLKHIADPLHTEIPAKAPWYFLGLQELLHYFPPFVAGVLIPGLIVAALIVIPYFDINIKKEGLWESKQNLTLAVLSIFTLIIFISMAYFHAWSISIPTVVLYMVMIIPFFVKNGSGWVQSLGRVSLTNWVMTWFFLIAVVLTVIGVFFRGPYWLLTLPWVDGIY